MELDSIEQKFLLRLLEYPPDYRSLISQIQPNSKTKASERDKACRALTSKGLVAYIEEIQRYRITRAGKTLLNQDTSVLPVTPDELALVRAATTKSATPGQAKQVPPSERQRLLHQLQQRGMIQATKTQIKEVWLTPEGRHYLLQEYTPTNSSLLMTSAMIGHYATFLRQTLATTQGAVASASTTADAITPEAVLETIRQLDRQLGTDNYLPIFHLRQALQPPLTREALDAMLYELQRCDRIELDTLQDVSTYSDAELAAGIPQHIGGNLFFISLI
ncbi:uncharacterized protein XM38_048360 [Halomicronema hongdechloris C2206]|uniref:Uncharacterized protein n=1 Tax=Halomicronema hongdechloris C2206 TaxID=1641165 RepID=A0A1Z3HUC2_9CYAN|nr:hypothetical protein [Halomicronema hongdechloris]ASC73862.1 uncharacterized protein XM38_048360 [Halomicronema hongdechloris C2206]